MQYIEELYHSIISTSPDGFWLMDKNGCILDVNRAYCNMSGYEREELLGAAISLVEMVESMEDTRKHITLLKETGSDLFTSIHRRKDGTPFHVEVSSAHVPDADGRFLCFIRDITSQKTRENQLVQKISTITDPEGDIGTLPLEEVINPGDIQDLMDSFYSITGMPVGIIDSSGKILVARGWQDICTRFHRCNPETRRLCIESDLLLTRGAEPGKILQYKCKNNMWDIASPIIVDGHHLGNLFLGQFFYDDEDIDREFFRSQARRYGFDEDAYLDALDRVPVWSRQRVEETMAFYIKLTRILTEISRSKLHLAQALQRKEQLEVQKGDLLKEMNHRIKNNLAIISSLINLKEGTMEGGADLSDLRHQVNAVMLVHNQLYHSDDVTEIAIRDYLEDLIRTVLSSFISSQVEADISLEDLLLPSKLAVSLGLIVNEIVVNSIKHAFPGEEHPSLRVDLSALQGEKQMIRLEVENNGKPFPEQINLDNTETLGLRLIRALADQIGAKLELERRPRTRFIITFPLDQ